MIGKRHDSIEPPAALSYRVPAWLRGGRALFADPGFVAGAALAALDPVMRDARPWSGVWRQRLALRAAAAACRRLGRTEDEKALRDLWQLRSEDGGLGPSGAVLRAYQQLARPDALDADSLARAARDFGCGEEIAAGALAQALKSGAIGEPPLQAAANAASSVMAATGREGIPAELFALWTADAVLAQTLGWKNALPLLSGEMLAAASPRLSRSGDAGWRTAAGDAVAAGAVRAVDLAGEMARRADKLQAVAPKVRTKQAMTVIATLLEQDAVTPAKVRGRMSDRAARRLFERLVALGGVRELSGRATFRIYGL